MAFSRVVTHTGRLTGYHSPQPIIVRRSFSVGGGSDDGGAKVNGSEANVSAAAGKEGLASNVDRGSDDGGAKVNGSEASVSAAAGKEGLASNVDRGSDDGGAKVNGSEASVSAAAGKEGLTSNVDGGSDDGGAKVNGSEASVSAAAGKEGLASNVDKGSDDGETKVNGSEVSVSVSEDKKKREETKEGYFFTAWQSFSEYRKHLDNIPWEAQMKDLRIYLLRFKYKEGNEKEYLAEKKYQDKKAEFKANIAFYPFTLLALLSAGVLWWLDNIMEQRKINHNKLDDLHKRASDQNMETIELTEKLSTLRSNKFVFTPKDSESRKEMLQTLSLYIKKNQELRESLDDVVLGLFSGELRKHKKILKEQLDFQRDLLIVNDHITYSLYYREINIKGAFRMLDLTFMKLNEAKYGSFAFQIGNIMENIKDAYDKRNKLECASDFSDDGYFQSDIHERKYLEELSLSDVETLAKKMVEILKKNLAITPDEKMSAMDWLCALKDDTSVRAESLNEAMAIHAELKGPDKVEFLLRKAFDELKKDSEGKTADPTVSVKEPPAASKEALKNIPDVEVHQESSRVSQQITIPKHALYVRNNQKSAEEKVDDKSLDILLRLHSELKSECRKEKENLKYTSHYEALEQMALFQRGVMHLDLAERKDKYEHFNPSFEYFNAIISKPVQFEDIPYSRVYVPTFGVCASLFLNITKEIRTMKTHEEVKEYLRHIFNPSNEEAIKNIAEAVGNTTFSKYIKDNVQDRLVNPYAKTEAERKASNEVIDIKRLKTELFALSEQLYDRTLRSIADDPVALKNMATIYSEKAKEAKEDEKEGYRSDALLKSQAAVMSSPTPRFLNAHAQALYRDGRYTAALDTVNKSLDMVADSTYESWASYAERKGHYIKGNILLEQGRKEEALANFKEAKLFADKDYWYEKCCSKVKDLEKEGVKSIKLQHSGDKSSDINHRVENIEQSWVMRYLTNVNQSAVRVDRGRE